MPSTLDELLQEFSRNGYPVQFNRASLPGLRATPV